MVTDISIYNKILSRILKEQETILGSLAWQIAEKISGMEVLNKETFAIRIVGDPKAVIDNFVFRCERIFGSFARDACKQAVEYLTVEMPINDIPERLR
jgi:hypothetical protein